MLLCCSESIPLLQFSLFPCRSTDSQLKRTCLIAPYFLPLSVSTCCSGSKRKHLFTSVTVPYKHIEYISCIPSLPLSPCKSRSLTSYRCFKVKAGADRVVKAPCSNTTALCSHGKSLRGGYQHHCPCLDKHGCTDIETGCRSPLCSHDADTDH